MLKNKDDRYALHVYAMIFLLAGMVFCDRLKADINLFYAYVGGICACAGVTMMAYRGEKGKNGLRK